MRFVGPLTSGIAGRHCSFIFLFISSSFSKPFTRVTDRHTLYEDAKPHVKRSAWAQPDSNLSPSLKGPYHVVS